MKKVGTFPSSTTHPTHFISINPVCLGLYTMLSVNGALYGAWTCCRCAFFDQMCTVKRKKEKYQEVKIE
ncbi:hypothetical protein BO83DRAFT_374872 [Aspergillus eucalypticola CBS 122712]|uniref:Uncharacterized protein n=1 Tax=Aspergillus eucalypticola (strain CBS 122712 / IBT 29274) TaxID=1448314 RepID=A0A317W9D1_ASPEC|nr:uncharacterized protein BO83DRAFT_374872 [Aspergillus eucalypticola CBS 122712]PWY82351.1 hypothetical protein BO83DRAFT_374872 [Aspergillus eucalypticola CBS 122712]